MDFCIHACAYCHESVSHYRTGCQEAPVVVGFHTDCPGNQPSNPPPALSVTPERVTQLRIAEARLQEALRGPKPPEMSPWGVAREND